MAEEFLRRPVRPSAAADGWKRSSTAGRRAAARPGSSIAQVLMLTNEFMFVD